MIKQGINTDILEKKFKILRTSIMLGNIEDKETTLKNYEKAAREVDDIRNKEYVELLAGKMYMTTTLEDEANRLHELIDFIQKRIDERNEFTDDYIKITANFLDDLPKIEKQDELDDLRIRLANIDEYLNNTKEIEETTEKLKKLRDELEEKYESKAGSEIINSKLEDELIDEFNKVIANDPYYSTLNYTDIDGELVKIEVNLKDKLEVMNTFISSYDALKDAGISGAEREEYLSYVGDAKRDYYGELEKKYILNIYKLVLDKQNSYDMLYQKREDIDRILTERVSKRRELEVNDRDILEFFKRLCTEQFSIIKSQKINIENIDKLILQITEAENRLEELDAANNRDEIVNLLNEFAVNKKEIEKIDLPVEEEIHEGVIKENKENNSDKPSNMVVRVAEPVKLDVNKASDTAKLVMKKVVIVLEPKKFNTKRDKLAEAEQALAEEKAKEEINFKEDLVTLDANNSTADTSDDVFLDTSSDVTINLGTEDTNEIKINMDDNISVPTEIFIEEPKEETIDLFSEKDPFLDDNEIELQKTKEESEEVTSDMPRVDNIGTVKPTSVLSQIEEATEENNDIILPTMGLTNNEKADVPIVSENYIQ